MARRWSPRRLPSHNALVTILGTVTNEGTLALESPSKGGEPGLVGTALQVKNEGVLTAASASSSAMFLETGLTNAAGATVEVKTGELRQDDNTTTANEGTFVIAAGQLCRNHFKRSFANKGTLEPDIASASFGTVKLSNGAKLEPGGTSSPS